MVWRLQPPPRDVGRREKSSSIHGECLSAADELIAYLAEFHLMMTLPKGLPTLQAMCTKNWTRVDNVFMSEDLAELMICCDTAPGLRGPCTDHVPIHTIIDTRIPPVMLKPYRNYRMVDWEAY